MGRFILRRVMHGVVVVFLVSVVVFVVTRLIGDPVQVMLPLEATEEQRAAFAAQLGFDQSIPVQFVDYIGDASPPRAAWWACPSPTSGWA
jgi:peptide/nickel transport system permease protein